jgi:serine/threonine protein kinase
MDTTNTNSNPDADADADSDARCEQCGASLPAGRLDGLCPRCLLRSGLSVPASSPMSPSRGFEPPTPEALNALLPGLEVLEMVGRGGMGAVYRAVHKKLDRDVAVKILPPELGEDPAFAERFVREARTMARLGHPYVVTVLDFGEAGGVFYLVLEFVEGWSLRELLRAGPPPAEKALQLAQEIAEALQYAHERGIVHRDVKPENVLVGEDGHVRIADFGLAKLLDPCREDPTLTGTRQAVGTPHYMSPEQTDRPDEVDARSDLFSLGVMLYELLTGDLPRGRFAPPSKRVAVGSDVDEVVLRALEPDPAERFESAAEMRAAIQTARETSKRADLLKVKAVEDPDGLVEEVRRSRDERKSKRQQMLLAGVVALAALILVSSFLDWGRWSFSGGVNEILRDSLGSVGITTPGAAEGATRVPSLPSMDPAFRFSISANAWRTHIAMLGLTIPNWLVVIVTLVAAGMAAGTLGLGWRPRWGLMFGLTVYGAAQGAVFLFQLLGAPVDATPQLGLILALLALDAAAILIARFGIWPPKPRVEKRQTPFPLEKRRIKRKRSRRTPRS